MASVSPQVFGLALSPTSSSGLTESWNKIITNFGSYRVYFCQTSDRKKIDLKIVSLGFLFRLEKWIFWNFKCSSCPLACFGKPSSQRRDFELSLYLWSLAGKHRPRLPTLLPQVCWDPDCAIKFQSRPVFPRGNGSFLDIVLA